MNNNLSKLNNHYYLGKVHSFVSVPANIAHGVLDLDKVGKTMGAIFKVFELPYMPQLSPFFQKLSSDSKVCLDVISSFKILFNLKELTGCDAVGRTYFETHTWTEISSVSLTLGANLLGTVRYVARLGAISLPGAVSLWRAGLTFGAFVIRAYNDHHAVIKLKDDLDVVQNRKTRFENKTINLKVNALYSKYRKKRLEKLDEIEESKKELNTICDDAMDKPLKERQVEADEIIKKIDTAKLKVNRCTQYLAILEQKGLSKPEKVGRLKELKNQKWANRFAHLKSKLMNKEYSRNFHGGFALVLALGMIATALAIQNLVAVSILTFLGVAVSLYGMDWMAHSGLKRNFDII